MNKIVCLIWAAFALTAAAQNAEERPRILYGLCTKDSLRSEPFAKWYNSNYDSYIPTGSIKDQLRAQSSEKITIKVFFGTWCGDSKREVPRFLKLLSAVSFPEKQVQLIALGSGDSLVKQSPGHEEAGLGIFRVPTFIIYKNGTELNRIIEFPVFSLEKDLLQILRQEPYSPNYRSFSSILRWIREGTLADENISVRGLAEQLRPLVSGEQELNGLGYLLLKQGKKTEALQVFRMNYGLYPESSNTAYSLAEGYWENNDPQKTVGLLERSLEQNKDPKRLRDILVLLYKAKEKD